jgi:hypothetical protein
MHVRAASITRRRLRRASERCGRSLASDREELGEVVVEESTIEEEAESEFR